MYAVKTTFLQEEPSSFINFEVSSYKRITYMIRKYKLKLVRYLHRKKALLLFPHLHLQTIPYLVVVVIEQTGCFYNIIGYCAYHKLEQAVYTFDTFFDKTKT
jgi:hypothetical protein